MADDDKNTDAQNQDAQDDKSTDDADSQSALGGDGDKDKADDQSALGGDGDGDDSGDDDGGGSKDQDGSGAPDTYEAFSVPDGYELDETLVEAAVPVLKELNLSQDQAQKVVDLYNGHLEQNAQAWLAAIQKQAEDLKNDPEVGGAAYGENLKTVRQFIGRWAGDDAKEIRSAIDGAGLGNHLGLFKFMLKLAKAAGEDSFGGGGDGGGDKSDDATERLKSIYDKMPESAFEDKQ